jgi:hypothetical protein
MDVENSQGAMLADIDEKQMTPQVDNDPQKYQNLSSSNYLNSSIQSYDEYFEDVDKRSQVIGNTDEFKKLFDEVKETKEKENREAVSFLKKKQEQEKKKKNGLEVQQKPEEIKKERILRTIEPHVKNYKAMNSPNCSDTEVAKLRADSKEKIFKFLLYGIEELKEIPPTELTPEELRITELTGKDPYGFAKTLASEIDVEFLSKLNGGNKQVAGTNYRRYVKALSNNIADDSNGNLRRKIISREFSAKVLVGMKESDYLPQHVREQMQEKQKALLRETEVPASENSMAMHSEYIEYPTEPYGHSHAEKREEERKEKYRYLASSSILLLRNLLKPEQIVKMRNLFEFENQKEIENRLVNHINKVFGL